MVARKRNSLILPDLSQYLAKEIWKEGGLDHYESSLPSFYKFSHINQNQDMDIGEGKEDSHLQVPQQEPPLHEKSTETLEKIDFQVPQQEPQTLGIHGQPSSMVEGALKRIEDLDKKLGFLLEKFSKVEEQDFKSSSPSQELFPFLKTLESKIENLEKAFLASKKSASTKDLVSLAKEDTAAYEDREKAVEEEKEVLPSTQQELGSLKKELDSLKKALEDLKMERVISKNPSVKKESVIPLVIQDQDEEITLQFRPKSRSKKKFSSEWRKIYRKTEELIQSPERQEDLLEIFTVGLLKILWITIMRLGLEAYQTLLMFWSWIDGYFRPSPNRFFQTEESRSSPVTQLVDLVKFGVWVIPSAYFWVYKEYGWAACYFFGYWLSHYAFKFLFSLLGFRFTLLPSAWEEISMKDYQFSHPFWDLCKVFLIMAPPVYLIFIQEGLAALLYLIVYLGLHFIISLIGKTFSKPWSLLPQPIYKKKEE